MAITRELAAKLIDELFAGKGLKLCFKENGIRPQDFFDLIAANPLLADQYARAQQARAELYADEILSISDEETDAQRARNRIDARKWYASKMRPDKYGERMDVNVNQTVDINAAITDARKRALPISYQKDVESAQVIEVQALPLPQATDSQSVVPAESRDAVGSPSKPKRSRKPKNE